MAPAKRFAAILVFLALCATPALAQLDQTCAVSVLNRTAQVREDRSWVLGNAPSSTGQTEFQQIDPVPASLTRSTTEQTARQTPARDVRRPGDADQAFERGRQLMEQNCGDCYKRSLAGAMEAVKQLRLAIANGRNDADVHRLLRDAYNGIAFIDYGNLGYEAENRRSAALLSADRDSVGDRMTLRVLTNPFRVAVAVRAAITSGRSDYFLVRANGVVSVVAGSLA